MDFKHLSIRFYEVVFVGLVLLPLFYLGSYLAALSLPVSVRVPSFILPRPTGIHASFVEINGQWNHYPDYHGLPAWLFAPVHDYDRTHLRPTLWSGSCPRNCELGFDWLIAPPK